MISSPADRFEPPTPAQLDAARSMVKRFAAKWAAPDADGLRELMHPDTQNLMPPMEKPGDRETVVEHFRGVLQRLPDLRIEVERWAPTGDAVMIEWRATASVAGKEIVWTGVDRFNIRGDKIYKGSVYWDTHGLSKRMMATVQAASTPSA